MPSWKLIKYWFNIRSCGLKIFLFFKPKELSDIKTESWSHKDFLVSIVNLIILDNLFIQDLNFFLGLLLLLILRNIVLLILSERWHFVKARFVQ